MSDLRLTRFGNPILRQVAITVHDGEVHSGRVRSLIADMKQLLASEEYGVGIAAPQLGIALAVCVICIRPTKLRPDVEPYEQVIINPSYTGVGRRIALWEGCLSGGSGDDLLYGKALRYTSIDAQWIDETGILHREQLTGFLAHVFQHETDHLRGILFVDRVRDPHTYMMADEYRKHVVSARSPKKYKLT